MRRLGYAILLGLVGAGIVHIVVLLLLPRFAARDAWSRLQGVTALYEVRRLDGASGVTDLPSGDPLFHAALCRFDLLDGVVHVRAPGGLPFWSVSVYDRAGRNLYSFNDRTTQGGALDMVVLTPEQMIELRKELPEQLEGSIFVEQDIEEGIALLRGFAPDPSWDGKLAAFFQGMSCRAQ